jgi:hypothetical protein
MATDGGWSIGSSAPWKPETPARTLSPAPKQGQGETSAPARHKAARPATIAAPASIPCHRVEQGMSAFGARPYGNYWRAFAASAAKSERRRLAKSGNTNPSGYYAFRCRSTKMDSVDRMLIPDAVRQHYVDGVVGVL